MTRTPVNSNITISIQHTLFAHYEIPLVLGCQSIFKSSGLIGNDPADFNCLVKVQANSEPITRRIKEKLHAQNGDRKHTDAADYAPIKRSKIAILQPITTGNLHSQIRKISDLLPISVWLCSFLQTIEPDKFQYRIYYGYDSGDPWYDHPVNGPLFRQEITKMIKLADLEDTVTTKYHRLEGYQGRITSLWNALAESAYNDGYEYYIPSNDDVRILTPGWASYATSILKHSPLYPNLGIVYFQDLGWPGFPSFHLVHRLHLDIFGAKYYDLPWEGAHQDPFIFNLYVPFNASVYAQDIIVKNHVGSGPRYSYGDRQPTDFLQSIHHNRIIKHLNLSESHGLPLLDVESSHFECTI